MEKKERSSTGLDENVAGFLCYLFGFVTGIVFLVVEKESRFVKFHAMQSTITFLGLFHYFNHHQMDSDHQSFSLPDLDFEPHPMAHLND